MKVLVGEEILDVVDEYQFGYVVPYEHIFMGANYKYKGIGFKDCLVIDESPIEFEKVEVKLQPEQRMYNNILYINSKYTFKKSQICDNDSIMVFNDAVVLRSPAKHALLSIPIKQYREHPVGKDWGFKKNSNGTITLKPSIKMTRNEYVEHFFIRNNQVFWQSDSVDYIYKKKEPVNAKR